MTPELMTAVVAIISALLGGGGVAAFVRAQGQNRTDLYQSAAERIGKLELRSDQQDERNEHLLESKAELSGRLLVLERDNHTLSERLRVQRILIDDQAQRLACLRSLEDENANLRQQLQIEMSKREFLEREIAVLRLEIAELRGQLQGAPHAT